VEHLEMALECISERRFIDAEQHLNSALQLNTTNRHGKDTVHPLEKAIANLAMNRIKFEKYPSEVSLTHYLDSFNKFSMQWSDMIEEKNSDDSITDLSLKRALDFLKHNENEIYPKKYWKSESFNYLQGPDGNNNLMHSSFGESNSDISSKSRVDNDSYDITIRKDINSDSNSVYEAEKPHVTGEKQSDLFEDNLHEDDKCLTDRILQLLAFATLSAINPDGDDTNVKNDSIDFRRINLSSGISNLSKSNEIQKKYDKNDEGDIISLQESEDMSSDASYEMSPEDFLASSFRESDMYSDDLSINSDSINFEIREEKHSSNLSL